MGEFNRDHSATMQSMIDRIGELESQVHVLNGEVAPLNEMVDQLQEENKRLRRALDNIKVRGYELSQREIHDMALAALKGQDDG
jgi:regulator of replication initiation timing